MRYKRLRLIGILLIGLGMTGLQAQTMHVNKSNGMQIDHALSNIRKMNFSRGNLSITKADNSGETYALSGLSNLNFKDLTIGFFELMPIKNLGIKIYPNPADDVMTIDLSGVAMQQGKISIISLEGKTIISRQITNGGLITLDISQLSKGIYLCRYCNAMETKTVKIIKN